MINVNKNQKKPTQHRLQKAKQIWGRARKKSPPNQKLQVKTRIMIWNALIRSTLTYALRTGIHGIGNQKGRESPTKISATNTQRKMVSRRKESH